MNACNELYEIANTILSAVYDALNKEWPSLGFDVRFDGISAHVTATNAPDDQDDNWWRGDLVFASVTKDQFVDGNSAKELTKVEWITRCLQQNGLRWFGDFCNCDEQAAS